MTYLKNFRWIILLSMLVLTGCETMTSLRQDFADKVFGREPPNPPATLQAFDPTYALKLDWSSSIGKTERYDYTPALDSSAVYANNAAGDIVKLDASNGRQVWRINIGEPISGGIGLGAGVLFVGTKTGNLHAIDAAGKPLWKAKVSSEILSVPRYFDGMAIVRTGDNHIFGLDATDGSRKWVFERTTPALSLRSSVGIVVDGGAVYAGFAGGKMVAIRADNGKLLWEATIAQPKGVTEIERIADITSLPVIDGPLVYAVAYQGRVAAVDRRSGKVVWNRDISSYTGMNAEDGKVFVSHALGSVYSLDSETGKTFWRQAGLLNRRLSAPLPMGNVVAVGDLEGYVHFLTRDDGGFAARIKLDGNAVMALIPCANSRQLIAETRDGGLYAISIADANAAPAAKRDTSNESKPSESNASQSAAEALKPETKSEPNSPDTERSIMFQKDPVFQKEPESSPDAPLDKNTGPGIKLPSN
ncbi:MAG: outer membrane protein assembly factor BamB [Bdellovibrio sp.]|nr:outer membrane protein assembly factor BamB [Methylotenera sp.]